ncbi:MAG: hypothetical protein AAFR93_08475 [Pseudomonadota bacterium]
MYAPDTQRTAWQTLWARIRAELTPLGIDAPHTLSWGEDAFAWGRPGLVLGQCCGRPLALGRAGAAQVVGAFDFGLTDCPPGTYRSAILRNPAGRPRAAINDPDSQSGCAALIAWTGRRLEAPLVTGAHLSSITALQRGEARLAAVDAQTYALWRQDGGALPPVELVDWTPPVPAPPLITAHAGHVAPLRKAVRAALGSLPEVAARLRLFGFVDRERADYALLGCAAN